MRGLSSSVYVLLKRYSSEGITHERPRRIYGYVEKSSIMHATFQLPLSHIKVGLRHGTYLTKRCRGHIACAGLLTLCGNTSPCFKLSLWSPVLLTCLCLWPSGMPQLSVFQTASGWSLGFFYCSMKWNVCSYTSYISGEGGLLAARDWCIERSYILCTLSLLSL